MQRGAPGCVLLQGANARGSGQVLEQATSLLGHLFGTFLGPPWDLEPSVCSPCVYVRLWFSTPAPGVQAPRGA